MDITVTPLQPIHSIPNPTVPLLPLTSTNFIRHPKENMQKRKSFTNRINKERDSCINMNLNGEV